MQSGLKLKRGILILALPLVAMACAQPTKTADTAALDPGEADCAARAAEAAGVDAGTVAVAQTTKSDTSTIYTATAGENSYMCVFDTDQRMTNFQQQ